MVRTWPELIATLAELEGRQGRLRKFVAVDSKEQRIAELEAEMARPGFWDIPTRSRATVAESSHLKRSLHPLERLEHALTELGAYVELLKESGMEEGSADFAAVDGLCNEAERLAEEVELASFLS
ncbi:MAG: PCRF domain-containing protein, partial [Puniceicoccales bacterium]|nr:PCRF domain-containing protein [Puniceicoccales bacterium]